MAPLFSLNSYALDDSKDNVISDNVTSDIYQNTTNQKTALTKVFTTDFDSCKAKCDLIPVPP